MPPESLTVAVSSGFGIGVIAGIVSGVCYILVHGFSGNRPRNNKNQWHCTVCGERFRSIGGVLDLDKVITCVKCEGKVCRKKCSNQDQGYWICQTCLNPESWFKGILKALHPNSIINKSIVKMDPNRIDEVDEDLESVRTKQKEQVRDFIERLVEGMLGGGIDGASIGRLYSDKLYDILITRYHSDLSNTLTDLGSALHMSIANLPILGQSPCSTHAGLKLLIQRIIQEAIGLPALKKVAEHPGAPVEEINRTYEDLLATAIINKVIENYQDELPTSSANSVSSRRSNLSIPNNKEYFFGEETLDSKWRNCNSAAGDVDTTSVSSMEEWVHSSSSTCSTKYVDHKSLKIQQRVHEASSSDEENRTKDWQENWKLQKRQFAGTASPIPVPMLVPNPTNEAKVLIGDREADDTTDLSDAGSEYDDIDGVGGNVLKSLILDDKNENEIVSNGTADDLDIVREQFSSYQSDSIDGLILEIINREVNLSGSLEDLDSHIEQDSEYTEKYATLPKTIVKCSTPIARISDTYLVNGVNNQSNLEISNNVTYTKSEEINEQEREVNSVDGELREKFKGSYSEREKQKWQNAVEMKNNPYTEENINRRLHRSSSAVASLFGRDYYIKEAAKATGARSVKDVDNDDAISKKLEDSSNESTSSDAFIFKAVPAVVEADASYHTDSESLIEVGSPVTPTSLLEISSDSDLSIERTYNLISGTVYEKIGNIHKEIIKRTSSPEGLKFTPTNTEEEYNTEIVDENHNSMTSNRKRLFLGSLTNSGESDSNDVLCEKQIDLNISKVPLTVSDETFVKKGVESVDYIHNNKTFSVQEVSMDFSTESEAKTSAESSLNSTPEAEIGDLKDKHLVKDRLGQFSKSYPNLAALPVKKSFAKLQSDLEDDDKQKLVTKLHNGFEGDEKCDSHQQLSSPEIDSSVMDLRKKFAAVQGKDDLTQKQVHSLTARSIPPVIRKELQEGEYKEELHNYFIASEGIVTPQELPDIKEKEELPIFPNAKSRIKFFENLNR